MINLSEIEFKDNRVYDILLTYLPALNYASLGKIKISSEYRDFVLDHTALLHTPGSYWFYATMGFMSEMGEVYDILTKSLRVGSTLDTGKLEEKLGDVLFYITLRADSDAVMALIPGVPDFPKTEQEYIEAIRKLEQINMDKINKRKRETGNHLK